MWDTKNIHNGYWYCYHTSNQQVRRMRCLYWWTHQRLVGGNDDITMKFAIALLVEKDRHRINWWTFEEEFCHRHKNAFEPMSKYHLRLEQKSKSWPINEVGSDTASKTRGEGDWLEGECWRKRAWKRIDRVQGGSTNDMDPQCSTSLFLNEVKHGSGREIWKTSLQNGNFLWSYSLTLAASYPWYVLVYDT